MRELPLTIGTTDTQEIETFLSALEEHRKNCVREGRYAEAEAVARRMKQAKEEDEERRRESLHRNHQGERAEVEEGFRREAAEFQVLWDQKIAEHNTRCTGQEDDLRVRHASELEEFQRGNGGIIYKPKFSPELLNLRMRQEKLVRQKKYSQADQLRQAADAQERVELAGQVDEYRFKVALFEEKLLQKQARERDALLERLTRSRNELARERDRELQKLVHRYDAARVALDKQNALEYRQLDRIMRETLVRAVVTVRDPGPRGPSPFSFETLTLNRPTTAPVQKKMTIKEATRPADSVARTPLTGQPLVPATLRAQFSAMRIEEEASSAADSGPRPDGRENIEGGGARGDAGGDGGRNAKVPAAPSRSPPRRPPPPRGPLGSAPGGKGQAPGAAGVGANGGGVRSLPRSASAGPGGSSAGSKGSKPATAPPLAARPTKSSIHRALATSNAKADFAGPSPSSGLGNVAGPAAGAGPANPLVAQAQARPSGARSSGSHQGPSRNNSSAAPGPTGTSAGAAAARGPAGLAGPSAASSSSPYARQTGPHGSGSGSHNSARPSRTNSSAAVAPQASASDARVPTSPGPAAAYPPSSQATAGRTASGAALWSAPSAAELAGSPSTSPRHDARKAGGGPAESHPEPARTASRSLYGDASAADGALLPRTSTDGLSVRHDAAQAARGSGAGSGRYDSDRYGAYEASSVAPSIPAAQPPEPDQGAAAGSAEQEEMSQEYGEDFD